jgi:hypothetical protein
MGMFPQLLGVITILMRLRAAQRQFPGQTLKLWWERRPRFRVRNIIVSAAGSAMSMATGRARLSITPGPQATLEQRVAMLEDSYTNLSGEVGGLGNEMRQRGDELSNKLHAEVAAREASDKKIEEQLKETAVGSLHLDAWGVVFFVIGIIAGTVSPEIAGWVGSGSCG